jgi:DNA-binding NtrC family response regulator
MTQLDRRHGEPNPSEQCLLAKMLGQSPQIQSVRFLIRRVSEIMCPVLILGESGTGKELVARAIHDSGARRGKPFVPVDCAALASSLFESELFGHVKGAFTGAGDTKRGLLKVADDGTVLLDEIGELPLIQQAKLLRTLQEREIRPVGSTHRISINVRVIAATNRDLETGVRAGAFRQDLFFRLNVVQIRLPPLRERKNDIPLLVDHFLKKFANPTERVREISDEAMRHLMNHDWPGNVRELEHAIESALALSSDSTLQLDDLPQNLHIARCTRGTNEFVSLEEVERRAIVQTLRQTRSDKLAAARLLGIGKTTLYRKLKQYAIPARPSDSSDRKIVDEKDAE